MSELKLTGRTKTLNILAWCLAAFVVIVGVVMLIVTGKRIFLLFVILGVLTGVNVVLYDKFVLQPQLAAKKPPPVTDPNVGTNTEETTG